MFHPRDHDDNIEFDAALAFIDSFETLESCSSERAEGLSSSDSELLTQSLDTLCADVNQSAWVSANTISPSASTTDAWLGTDTASLEEHKSPCSSVSASNDHPAQVSTTLRNARELKSNPNRARDERRRELRALRAEAAELQTKLETLREVRRDIAQRNLPPSRTARGPCWELARRIWLGTAQRQFNQRMAAVQENKRLTDLVKANDDIISKLQSTLRQWSPDTTMLALDPEVEHCLQSYDFDALFNVNVDQLMANTDSSYQQINQVFNQSTVDLASISSCSTPEMRSDAAGNLFSQVFGSKIFPFAAQETSRVVWDVVSDCVRPSSRCLFNHILHSTDHVVVESCGTELHTDSKSLLFHTLQIKRRYQEQSREVIVWQSVVRPVLFKGRPLQGAAFEENGVFLIHRPPLIPDGFALLQTSYVITPRTRMRQLPTNPLARSVADFVLKWMAASIPANHQIFEDALVGQQRCGIPTQ